MKKLITGVALSATLAIGSPLVTTAPATADSTFVRDDGDPGHQPAAALDIKDAKLTYKESGRVIIRTRIARVSKARTRLAVKLEPRRGWSYIVFTRFKDGRKVVRVHRYNRDTFERGGARVHAVRWNAGRNGTIRIAFTPRTTPGRPWLSTFTIPRGAQEGVDYIGARVRRG